MSIKDVKPEKLIRITSQELKKIEKIKPPNWAKFVKTGVHKQRPPEQEDWWYIKTASVLRRIYLDGPVGVSRLRTFYGGRIKRHKQTEHFRKASGNIIRKILQQLESSGLVETVNKKGRIITSKGKKFLDELSRKVVENE